MKRFMLSFLFVFLLTFGVAALAQGDVTPVDTQEEILSLLWLVATSAGSTIVGLALKKWPAFPNELIPHMNGALATILFATLGGLDIKAAALAGMAAAYGATVIKETGTLLTKKETK